jgi:hypothetical protein
MVSRPPPPRKTLNIAAPASVSAPAAPSTYSPAPCSGAANPGAPDARTVSAPVPRKTPILSTRLSSTSTSGVASAPFRLIPKPPAALCPKS